VQTLPADRPSDIAPRGGALGTSPATVAVQVRGGKAEAVRVGRRAERFRLRDRLRKVTGMPRVARCGWKRVNGGWVQIRWSDPAAHFSGLALCGRVWVCPVCGPKIRQGRAEEIGAALAAAVAQGWGVEFGTFTLRHHRGQKLADLLDLQREVWRALRQDHEVRDLFAALGFLGLLNVQEITHGDNGWHPHRHVALLFAQVLDDAQRRQLEDGLWRAWSRGLSRRGASAVRAYGTVVKQVTAAEGLAWYLTKVDGKGSIGLEMARGDLKTGKLGSRTPGEVLADALDGGEVGDVALWREYEQATAGRKMTTWTPGLRRRLLGALPEQSDEELAEAEVGGEVLAYLGPDAWRAVRGASPGGVAALEAAEGGVEALERYLRRTIPGEPGEGRWEVLRPQPKEQAA
jgi:hypothetical protein